MLNNSQKSAVRMALGHSDLFRLADTRLESILSSDSLSDEAEALIVTQLNSLAQVEAFILGNSISTAGIKRIDVIELYQGRSSSEIRGYGRMYVGRISTILGCPVVRDIFASGGYCGNVLRLG